MTNIEDFDIAQTKLMQAKSLASLLYGNSGEAIIDTVSRDDLLKVCWLLSDTIDDAYRALDRWERSDSKEKARVASAG